MNCLTNFEKHNPQTPLPGRPVGFIKGEFYQFNISVQINLIQVVNQNITNPPSKWEFRGLFNFSVPLSPIPEPLHI